MVDLERVLAEIRKETPRKPQETLPAWYGRTYRLARLRIEQGRTPLPLVLEAKERTNRLLKTVGKPDEEKDDE